MVQLRKYRTMTSKDGLEDEGDWSLSGMHMFQSVDGGRPLDSSGSIEERGDSKIFVLSEQPLAPLVLVLWLDSGATHHAVGDARILCNLRDPPAGTAVRAADGVRLLVHKIGDIHTEYIKIQDVYLVPGLQENLISVCQLAKHKIVTTFYENYAELCLEGKQVGGAITDSVTSLYRLRYLTTPTGDPEAGTRYIREEAMDVATARGVTSRSSFMQLLLSLSTSTSTKSKQPQQCLKQRDNVFQCRTCGCCFTTFQALGGHRTSHTRRHRVHADDLDLLGARSGKGAAQHSAAAFLSPSIQYNPEIKFFSTIKEEFYLVLDKVLTTPDLRHDITAQLHAFHKAQGMFGSNIAKEARNNTSPGMWWEQYGDSAPSLQRAAVRITSQVCSTLTFQRDWGLILQNHYEKRHKLDKEALADQAYAHYNLTLHSEPKAKKRLDADPIALDTIDMTSAWVEDSDGPILTQWLDRFPSALMAET